MQLGELGIDCPSVVQGPSSSRGSGRRNPSKAEAFSKFAQYFAFLPYTSFFAGQKGDMAQVAQWQIRLCPLCQSSPSFSFPPLPRKREKLKFFIAARMVGKFCVFVGQNLMLPRWGGEQLIQSSLMQRW